MWLLLASSDPSDPSGWITQAGLGVALILSLIANRYQAKQLDEERARGRAQTERWIEVVPLLADVTKLIERMRDKS